MFLSPVRAVSIICLARSARVEGAQASSASALPDNLNGFAKATHWARIRCRHPARALERKLDPLGLSALNGRVSGAHNQKGVRRAPLEVLPVIVQTGLRGPFPLVPITRRRER